jgi:hypothetical protein
MNTLKKLKQFIIKPQKRGEKKHLKDWREYVRPMEGDTVHVSENIDEFLYGKEG